MLATTGSSSNRRDAADVLAQTKEILATARQGLSDLLGGDPTRRTPGIRNVAVFGRSVTFVLQNLRAVDHDAFDLWYEQKQSAMRIDPLLVYFKDLRNQILKQGGPTATSNTHIEHMNTDDLAPLMANRPPGAKGFFIGDQLGGSGWEIELPDGATEKYYVDLPDSVKATTSLHFPDPPTEHLGAPIADTSLENLAQLYIAYLSSLVEEAEANFG
jgi:hypothetical protein